MNSNPELLAARSYQLTAFLPRFPRIPRETKNIKNRKRTSNTSSGALLFFYPFSRKVQGVGTSALVVR
jgi:hypothetical protein